MTRSYVDIDAAVAALRSMAPQMTEAIRDIKDPNASAIGRWSAGDVAAHLIDVAEDHQNVAQGRGTKAATSEEITELNDKLLAARRERDPKALADAFEEEVNRYLAILDSVEGDPIVSWTDLKIPLSTVISADIAEWIVHGWDITHAEGRPWAIDPYSAGLSTKGLSPVMPHYVDPAAAAGFTATFGLKLRGQWTLYYVFTNGQLSVEETSDRRVDVHISADPAAFMLVGYGRISQLGPVLKGQLVSWGRKPWLALKFASLLRNP